MSFFGRIRSLGSHKAQHSLQHFFEQFEILKDAARSLYQQSENLKKIGHDQSAKVESSSSSLHEISSMIEKTTHATQELGNVVSDTTQAVTSGEAHINNLRHSFESLQSLSSNLDQSVGKIISDLQLVNSIFSEIKQKTGLVNDVAFQTKLLSFNASVEAARAGEHGQGFAVVAQEMANLAGNSAQASKEIEKILLEGMSKTQSTIQQLSDELRHLSKATASTIQEGMNSGQLVIDQFSSISKNIKRADAMGQEILTASSEQLVGAKEVANAFQHLSVSAGQLAQVSENAYKISFEQNEKIEEMGKHIINLGVELGVDIVVKEKPFDFQAAINAHIDWKMKLSKYLENPDGTLDPEKVCLDNQCLLGKWIYGAGSDYKSVAPKIYEELRHSHGDFHQTAGKIIGLINHKDKQAAGALLSPTGPYNAISERTVKLIGDMRSIVHDSAAQSTTRKKSA